MQHPAPTPASTLPPRYQYGAYSHDGSHPFEMLDGGDAAVTLRAPPAHIFAYFM